jgi:sulfur-carrier protein adenylyltransferase/sulfurtransferase
MGVMDYFRTVKALNADELKEFLREKNLDEYNLVDVRQPKEYERGHIPGARLIPLALLRDRVRELDGDRPTIVY